MWACITFTVALASEPASPTLTEVELQYAQDLLASGRFVETIQVLKAYHYPEKYRTEALFLLGLASVELATRRDDEVRQDLLADAVTAFRDILNRDPTLLRVRLELARAFFLSNKDMLARQEFERVLASDPPPAVQANIQGFLAVIQARRRSHGSLSFQVHHDNNYNRGTNNPTIWFRGIPFIRDDSDPEAETSIVVNVRGDYRHPVTDTLDLMVGAWLARTEFPGSAYDSTRLEFQSGPEVQLSSSTRIGVYGVIIANNNKSSPNRKLGLQASLQHRFDNRSNIALNMTVGKRTYRKDEDTDNNANEIEAGLMIQHRLTPTLIVNGGISTARSNTRNNPGLKSRTLDLNAGVSSLLRNGWTVSLSTSLSRKAYQGQPGFPTRDGRARKDVFKTLQATLLHRDFTIGGFSPQLALIHERLKTNAQASNYRNTRAQVTMARQF